jgi:hypothetical protein
MDEHIFCEYEPIIRYSLDYVGFNGAVSIIPGLHPTFIYVLSKYRKDCVIDTDASLLTILIQTKPIIIYPTTIYTIVDQVNLIHPNSIQNLGSILSDILIYVR